MSPASELLRTIQQYGMVGCNVCPYLRSIDEVGGSWQAAMELIDQKQIFYSKVFHHRTVYLSRELYGLLKCIRGEKEVSYNYNLQRLLTTLQGGEPMSTQELKAESGFTGDTYSKAFQKLLENLDVTAYAPYKTLHPTWSSLLYSTSQRWEAAAGFEDIACGMQTAKDRIRALLRHTLTAADTERLIKHVMAD